MQLLGRIAGTEEGGRILLAPGLHESLAKIDKFEADLIKLIDEYIQKSGMSAPEETLTQLRDGFEVDELAEIKLQAAGISTIIWSIGYTFDLSLVRMPVTDSDGYPIQQRGVTDYPGLYFVGLPWLHKYKSGLLVGVGEDAEYVAEQITIH